MKIITPFTILNQNFHEMDLIREAMNKRRLLKPLNGLQATAHREILILIWPLTH